MSTLTVKTGTEEDFFKRGRQLARTADRGEQLPNERIVSFEDPADLMKLITAARLALSDQRRPRGGARGRRIRARVDHFGSGRERGPGKPYHRPGLRGRCPHRLPAGNGVRRTSSRPFRNPVKSRIPAA